MLKQILQDSRSKLFSLYETRRLKDTNFAIISNNCWGYELYHSVNREYNTPFIGLFMLPDCYLRFLADFDSLINEEPRLSNTSKYFDKPRYYPVGVVGDGIEIHFLHYKSLDEALHKWTRRTERLQKAIKNDTPLFIKLCDNESCTIEHLAKFHTLPFKNKISIGVQNLDSPNHIHVPELKEKNKNTIIDGAKLFNKRYRYFDITEWILNSKIKNTLTSKSFGLLS